MKDGCNNMKAIQMESPTQSPESKKTTSSWSRSVQHVKRVRTDEERLRRHLHGDKGAKFSSRKLVSGTNGIWEH